eukprot:GHVS01072053.1.p1 GENE.GHVS01072053.1~~GHVS01072053.1.p1  ORF type:complete len:199 (+),score=20.85 GHVS01072053.1:876-1472(+)
MFWSSSRLGGCQPSGYLKKDLGVKLGFSSAGYPQGNAINESFPVLLGEATMAYNAAPNSSIGDSPYRRLLGMESRLPGLTWLPLPSEEGRQQLQAEGRVQQALRVAIESQNSLQLHPSRHLWPLPVFQQLESASVGGGCRGRKSRGPPSQREEGSSSHGSCSPLPSSWKPTSSRPRGTHLGSSRSGIGSRRTYTPSGG